MFINVGKKLVIKKVVNEKSLNLVGVLKKKTNTLRVRL